MKKELLKRFVPTLWVVGFVLLSIGITFILINTGVIHFNAYRAPADPSLIYNGRYIDLLSLEQQNAPLNENAGVRITRIDIETGFPTVAVMTLSDKNGNVITRTKTVRFTYHGLPAMLRFTNNIADGFTYLNSVSDHEDEGSQTYIWETEPDLLRDALSDYSSQVLTIPG